MQPMGITVMLNEGADDFVYIVTEPRLGYKTPKIDGYKGKGL